MKKIVVHDTRLEGSTPHGNDITPICVGRETRLTQMVRRVREASTRFGTEVRLNVLCHGYHNEQNQLGYGLQLCQEELTLETVTELRELNGCLSYGIDIYACGAANTAPWCVGQHGDGWLLCSRIAQTTQSVVRAAVLTQYYHYFPGIFGLFRRAIDFGRWEGRVITFDARGNEVGSENNPAR